MPNHSVPIGDAHLALLVAHRPYGLDCKCGVPINSDEDWARHFIDATGVTAEEQSFYDHAEPYATAYETRLVTPWVTSEH